MIKPCLNLLHFCLTNSMKMNVEFTILMTFIYSKVIEDRFFTPWKSHARNGRNDLTPRTLTFDRMLRFSWKRQIGFFSPYFQAWASLSHRSILCVRIKKQVSSLHLKVFQTSANEFEVRKIQQQNHRTSV